MLKERGLRPSFLLPENPGKEKASEEAWGRVTSKGVLKTAIGCSPERHLVNGSTTNGRDIGRKRM
jgi:hypothetical protein